MGRRAAWLSWRVRARPAESSIGVAPTAGFSALGCHCLMGDYGART
jgi:hypothetical protein